MKSLHNDFSNFDITNSKYIKKLFITELDNYTKERHEIQTYDNPNYNYLSDTWNSLKMELNNIGIIVEKELDNEINVLIEKKYKELNSTFNSTKINEKKEYDKNLMKEADEVTKYNEDAIKKAHNLINMMENNLITTDENGNIVYLNEETENNKKVF